MKSHEAAEVPGHSSISYTVSIRDFLLCKSLSGASGFFFVYPVWKLTPLFWWYDTKAGMPAGSLLDYLSKRLGEGDIVEEDVRVSVLELAITTMSISRIYSLVIAIKAFLDRSQGVEDAGEVFVSCQYHEDSIRTP